MVSVESFKAAVGRTGEIWKNVVQEDNRNTAGKKADRDEEKQATQDDTECTDDNDNAPKNTSNVTEAQAVRDVEIDITADGLQDTQAAAQASKSPTQATGGDKYPPLPSLSGADTMDPSEQKSQSLQHIASDLLWPRCCLYLISARLCCPLCLSPCHSVGRSAVSFQQCSNVTLTPNTTPRRGPARACHPLHTIPHQPLPAAAQDTASHLVAHTNTPSSTRTHITYTALSSTSYRHQSTVPRSTHVQ